MSRTPPSQADLKIDGSQMIVLDYDQETNFVTTFSCQQLVENNVVTPVEVDFFYDLAFSSDVEPEMARKEFEAQLLDRIASEWGLASGNACISPPLTGHFYLVQVSSLPEDQPNQAFDGCFELNFLPGQQCVSYVGTVTGFVSGPDDSSELVSFVASSINGGYATAGTSMNAVFLGTHIDTGSNAGRDNLASPINSANEQQQAAPRDDTFTFVGVLMVVALCCAFMGLAFIIFRLRRRRQQVWREEEAFMQSQDESGGGAGAESARSPNSAVELPSAYGDFTDFTSEGLPEPEEEYQFDLGDSMKMGVLGVHSDQRTMFSRRYQPSEPDESDVDSWAQTDATIGSLDVRIAMGETSEI